MPYGGKDEEQKKRSKNVYDYIIRPAVEELGFEVIREDEAATPGNISSNIVKNLSKADIVIADLTNGNGNVFYELGIRHTMFKKHTILMIEEAADIKFDLSAYQVIQYRLDFNALDKAKKDIQKGIRLREKDDLASDNLVHDVFPTLPINLMDYINNSMEGFDYSERIGNLTQENTALREDLEREKKRKEELQKQLDEAGLSRTDTAWELEDVFQKAENAMQFSGEQAVLKLQQLAQGNDFDKQKFLEYLKKVLQVGEINITDHISISQICHEKGLLPFRRLVLERAHDYAPMNDSVITRLIDCYTDSAVTYPKALALINEWIGIQMKDGKLSIMPEKCSLVSANQLSALFDSYFALNKYEEIIHLVENHLKKHGCVHFAIMQRNLARAYQMVGNREKAHIAFDELFKTSEGYKDPLSHRIYGAFLDSIGKADLEYEQDEIAIALEPNNYISYLSIAGDIFDDQYIRCDDLKIQKVDRQSAKKAAIPFIFRALEIGGDAAWVEVQRMLLRNHCDDALVELHKQLGNETFPLFDEYNDVPLLYCTNQLPQIVEQKIDSYQ